MTPTVSSADYLTRQLALEKELNQLRSLLPSSVEEWWASLDSLWKILFVGNLRKPLPWSESWQWATSWDADAIQPTASLYGAIQQIAIFRCALPSEYPKITSLKPLFHLKCLVGLNCGKSPVTDLWPVSHLTGVRYLDINDTSVRDLTPIADWQDLEWLNIQNNFNQAHTDLSAFKRLKRLNLRYAGITDLSCISMLTDLEYLNIGYTNVRSLEPIKGLNKLRTIYMPKTNVPVQEITDFCQSHPECQIGTEQGDFGVDIYKEA